MPRTVINTSAKKSDGAAPSAETPAGKRGHADEGMSPRPKAKAKTAPKPKGTPKAKAKVAAKKA